MKTRAIPSLVALLCGIAAVALADVASAGDDAQSQAHALLAGESASRAGSSPSGIEPSTGGDPQADARRLLAGAPFPSADGARAIPSVRQGLARSDAQESARRLISNPRA